MEVATREISSSVMSPSSRHSRQTRMLRGVQFTRFVDSHTEGEPTRVLLGPDGGMFPITLDALIASWTRDGRVVVPDDCLSLAGHPRAADATVCACVCRPSPRHSSQQAALCGVLFWNAAGVLGMCGHGTIGMARTLAHLGVCVHGCHVIETRVGDVSIEFIDDGRVAFENVPSRVHARDVEVVLEEGGVVRGDIAWGGNWFFIVRLERSMRSHAEELTFSSSILRGLQRARIAAGAENNGIIDHVHLVFPASRSDANARNFVLCPNGTFDRSPCGTGTSALLALLAARGELAAGAPWKQESAISSIFDARWSAGEAGAVRPRIIGRAFIVAEGTLVHDARDPSRSGAWREHT